VTKLGLLLDSLDSTKELTILSGLESGRSVDQSINVLYQLGKQCTMLGAIEAYSHAYIPIYIYT